jgi:hypothetical protein
MSTLHVAHVVIASEHVSRSREQFEVLRCERRCLIGA